MQLINFGFNSSIPALAFPQVQIQSGVRKPYFRRLISFVGLPAIILGLRPNFNLKVVLPQF